MVAQPGSPNAAVVELTPTETNPEPATLTQIAETMGQMGGVRAAAALPEQQ
jgi:hypothetical protein